MGQLHTIPQGKLCPAAEAIELNQCEDDPQKNSMDETPLDQYDQCHECFPQK